MSPVCPESPTPFDQDLDSSWLLSLKLKRELANPTMRSSPNIVEVRPPNKAGYGDVEGYERRCPGAWLLP